MCDTGSVAARQVLEKVWYGIRVCESQETSKVWLWCKSSTTVIVTSVQHSGKKGNGLSCKLISDLINGCDLETESVKTVPKKNSCLPAV